MIAKPASSLKRFPTPGGRDPEDPPQEGTPTPAGRPPPQPLERLRPSLHLRLLRARRPGFRRLRRLLRRWVRGRPLPRRAVHGLSRRRRQEI